MTKVCGCYGPTHVAYLGAAQTGHAVLPLLEHLSKPEVHQTDLVVYVQSFRWRGGATAEKG